MVRTLLDEDERALRVAALLEALGERELGLEVGRLLGDDCAHDAVSVSAVRERGDEAEGAPFSKHSLASSRALSAW